MSLVAYASSGEDSDTEESENEEERTTDQTSEELPVKSLKTPGVVSSSSDISSSFLPKQTRSRFEANTGVTCGTSLSSFLPPPKFTTSESSTLQTRLGENGGPSGAGLDKKLLGTQNIHVGLDLAFDSNSYEEEILEIEEYVPSVKPSKPEGKPKEKDDTLKSVGSFFSLLAPPWKAEGRVQRRAEDESNNVKPKKQLVKIAIPTAPELDSDEEADEPVLKKPKPSKGGSGLSSLLPKPKHSITVKANPNKPTTKLSNRPLIPYTLSKKPAAAKSVTKKGSTSSKYEPEGEISDEDEPTSFFSFEERRPDTIPDSSTAVKPSVKSITETVPAAMSELQNLSAVDSSSESIESVSSSSVLRISSSAPAVCGSSQSTVSVAPYREDYCSSSVAGVSYGQDQVSTGTSYAGDTDTYGSATGPYYDVTTSEMAATYYGTQAAPAGNHYYSGYGAPAESSQIGGYSQAEEYSYGSQAQPVTQQDNIDIEKLKRIQGKRNRDETINIIDINAQDQIGDTEVMMTKMASEETSHRSAKKKGDMPSSQQRRKHQITYLAHQAKEREFELRNQWSTNRQTKKQTQSKYGF